MPMASKYRSFFSTLFYSFGLSLCVETFQLLTKVGSFDVDDLLLNTLGGVVGYMIFVIGARIRDNMIIKRRRRTTEEDRAKELAKAREKRRKR